MVCDKTDGGFYLVTILDQLFVREIKAEPYKFDCEPLFLCGLEESNVQGRQSITVLGIEG